MDLWAFRVLDAVVSTGSVSDAASLVRRTQPQVSRIVAKLEAELGLSLFVRQGRRLQPTADCHRILAHGRKILDDWDNLRATARQLRREQSPSLHLVGPPYAIHGIMPQVVTHLRHDWPDLEISLTTMSRQDNGVWNAPSVFDVGLGILPFELPNTRQEALGLVQLALIVPAGHPLDALTDATAADIAGHAFIALRPAAPLRRRVDQIFEAAGIAPRITATVPDTTAALLMVMEGLGIAIGDAFSASQIGGNRVRCIPFGPAQKAKVGVFWPSDIRPSRYAEAFFESARKTLLSHQPFFQPL